MISPHRKLRQPVRGIQRRQQDTPQLRQASTAALSPTLALSVHQAAPSDLLTHLRQHRVGLMGCRLTIALRPHTQTRVRAPSRHLRLASPGLDEEGPVTGEEDQGQGRDKDKDITASTAHRVVPMAEEEGPAMVMAMATMQVEAHPPPPQAEWEDRARARV